jgi:hypothetical protein
VAMLHEELTHLRAQVSEACAWGLSSGGRLPRMFCPFFCCCLFHPHGLFLVQLSDEPSGLGDESAVEAAQKHCAALQHEFAALQEELAAHRDDLTKKKVGHRRRPLHTPLIVFGTPQLV